MQPKLVNILSSTYHSVTSWCKDHPKLTISFATGVYALTTAYLYHNYRQLSVNDDEESTNIDYPRARRLLMSKQEINCPDDIEMIEEYVQMPDGIVLYSRCYVPKVYI